MYINNFSQLKYWMRFDKGTYYKFVALIRNKDFTDKSKPVLVNEGRGEHFIRQWFIGSQLELDKYAGEMTSLCKATGARLYVTTDRKSIKKTILKMQDQLAEYVKQMLFDPNAAISLRKLSKFSSSASQMKECSAGPKYWLIDVDLNSVPSADRGSYLCKLLEAFRFALTPYSPVVHITPNGAHILVERSFDIHEAIDLFLRQCTAPTFSLKVGDEELILGGSDNLSKHYHKVLTDNKDCWEVKENALTLVFMDMEEENGEKNL